MATRLVLRERVEVDVTSVQVKTTLPVPWMRTAHEEVGEMERATDGK